jgi:hypothetical protein
MPVSHPVKSVVKEGLVTMFSDAGAPLTAGVNILPIEAEFLKLIWLVPCLIFGII